MKFHGLIWVGDLLFLLCEGLDVGLDGLADFLFEGHGGGDFFALVVVLIEDGGGDLGGEEE